MAESRRFLDLPNGSEARRLHTLPIERIGAARLRLRAEVDDQAVAELAESILRHGLMHPISVRLAAGGCYELISGERRLRAMVRLGKRFVDAFVVEASDLDAALMALSENLQREGLHYLEEAEAFRQVIQRHQLSQTQLAQRIGRSQSMVANRLRLLGLSEPVQLLLRQSPLSERHARALLKLPSQALQMQAVRMAIERRLSVRQLEELAVRLTAQPGRNVKLLVRDQRVLINTVLETVKLLRLAGVNASGRVVDEPDHIDVIVTLPKLSG